MPLTALLKRLSESIGVSGNEGETRSFLAGELREKADEIRVDTMGNLIVVQRPIAGTPEPSLRVMLAAHMDEIGLMVTYIEKNGYLKFRAVGGIDPRLLLGKRVLIGKYRIPGILTCKTAHLLKEDEGNRVQDIDSMTIDIGAGGRDEASKHVRLGDSAVFATDFSTLGLDNAGGKRLVKGKAFDDRAGCAVLATLLQERYPVEVAGVFTVQEEVGLRGARVAAYSLNPDLAIVFEGTICDDLPKEKEGSPVTRVGKGPALTIADRSFVAHRSLLELLIDTAEEERIPIQLKEPALGGTDAGAISLSREGVPCAAVSVPCRYIHGPASVLSLEDLEATAALMRAILRKLGAWEGAAGFRGRGLPAAGPSS